MAEDRPQELIYDWNQDGGAPAPRKVLLDDETLRDGLQSPSVTNPSIDEKVEILRLMAKIGIQKVDLGLPGAGPQHLDHITRLLEVITQEKLALRPGLAVRTVVAEIEPIGELQQRFGIPIQASAFLGTSPIRKFVESWTNDLLLERIDAAVGFATENQIPCMFVTEDTTRSHPDDLTMVYTRALEKGARALCVADTCGHATPDGARSVIRHVKKVVEDFGADEPVEINWHGHSDRGLALANSLAAWEAGADCLHGTALGIGERSGNAAMDQLLVNLRLMGAFDGDLTLLPEYCRLVSEATDTPISRQYPVFGADAFDTATGVHAAAVVKALRTGDEQLADRVYSGVPAGEFGLEQRILVGHMSGKANVLFWLERRGIEPSDELVMKILTEAKASRRPLEEARLMELAGA